MSKTDKLKSALWGYPISALALSALLTAFFFPVAKAPRNIAAIALILFAVMTAASLKRRLRAISVDLLAFVLVFAIPVLWFFHPGLGPYGAYAKEALFVVDMFALLFCLRIHPVMLKNVIYAVVTGTVFTAGISLLQYSGLIPMRDQGAPVGLLNGTLTGAFSLLLVFSAGICSYLFRQAQGRRSRWLFFSAIVLLLADLLLAVPGRTGYLAAVVLGGYILYNLAQGSRLLAAGSVLLALCVGLNSAVLSERVQAVQSDLTQYSAGAGAKTSVGARFEMWKTSWLLFREHPLLGAGTNGFKVAWEQGGFKNSGLMFDNPHSTYFYLLANYGIAGIGLLFFLLWRMARFAWLRRQNLVGAVIFCYLIVFMVGSLTNTMLTSSFYLTWLAIMGAIMAGVSDGVAGE
jgi:O-antigen ligase